MLKENKSPFRFTNYIKSGKDLTEDELKELNVYLLNRMYYYSGEEKRANVMNYYWNIPKDLQWKLMKNLYKDVKSTRWIKKFKKK